MRMIVNCSGQRSLCQWLQCSDPMNYERAHREMWQRRHYVCGKQSPTFHIRLNAQAKGRRILFLDSPEPLRYEGAGRWPADRLPQGYAHPEHHQLPELLSEAHDHAAHREQDDALANENMSSIVTLRASLTYSCEERSVKPVQEETEH